MNKATRILLVYQLRQILPGIILGLFAILLVVWLYLGNTVFTADDEMGKPAWHQIGVVTSNMERPVSRGNPDPANLVGIQVGTKMTVVNTHTPLHIGQKLNVDYTIGRSGTLYIDRFVPIVTPR